MTTPLVHPTAIIDPLAQIAPDVRVGPYAVIEGPVTIGAGSIIHAGAYVKGPLVMGQRNVVHSTAVLGDCPQDHKFHGEATQTIIGDDNVFREGCTIHRATGQGGVTRIGSRGFFMAQSHVGHNVTIMDDVTMMNTAAVAGHSIIESRAILGAHCGVHQFCRVGRLAMLTNACAMNVDMPPFFISMSTNCITQLNAVGMRRSGMPRENISAIRRAFQLLFRTNRTFKTAMADLPPDLLAVPEVQELLTFCRATKRGLAQFQPWSQSGTHAPAEEP